MKPSAVFFAALVYFTCLSVILMVSLKISSGTADISDFVFQWGFILFASGYFALIAWYWSRGKIRTKDQSDSKEDQF
jgi:hypothetical protein